MEAFFSSLYSYLIRLWRLLFLMDSNSILQEGNHHHRSDYSFKGFITTETPAISSEASSQFTPFSPSLSSSSSSSSLSSDFEFDTLQNTTPASLALGTGSDKLCTMKNLLKKEIISILKELDNHHEIFVYSKIKVAGKALNLIFEMYCKGVNFSEEEKQQIKPLLLNAVKPIQQNIELTACTSRSRLESAVLIKRSAIQFLVDEYGIDRQLQQCVSILNNIIEKYSDLTDSSEGESDLEEAGASYMPDKHFWWVNVKSQRKEKTIIYL